MKIPIKGDQKVLTVKDVSRNIGRKQAGRQLPGIGFIRQRYEVVSLLKMSFRVHSLVKNTYNLNSLIGQSIKNNMLSYQVLAVTLSDIKTGSAFFGIDR